jgi:hypothetical protein
VKIVGKPAAIVIGVLDFLDRAQPDAWRPVASRARLIADLEGFVGKGAIDDALKMLTEKGWVRRHENTRPGKNNLITTVDYSLNANAIIKHRESVYKSRFRRRSRKQQSSCCFFGWLSSSVPTGLA